MSQQKYSHFIFRSSVKNPHFEDNLTCVSRLSRLYTPNVNKSQLFIVNPLPRREYYYTAYNDETMEIESIKSDSNKKRAFNLNRRLLQWAEIVNIGWKQKKFSVVFLTLTGAEINSDMRTFLNHYRIKMRRKGIEIISYAWVLEFGTKGNNPHYHCAVVVNRTKNLNKFCPCNNCIMHNTEENKKSPCLGLWNSFVKTEFVKHDVSRYMSKYLQKGDLIVCNRRRFGIANLQCTIKTFS